MQWRVATHQFNCFVKYVITTAIVYHDFNEYKNAGTIVEVTDIRKFRILEEKIKLGAKKTACWSI